MNGTTIRLVGGSVLIGTVVLLAVVSHELVTLVFGVDPLATAAATVPLSESELVPLVALLLALVSLTVVIWFWEQSPNAEQYNGEE